MTGRPIADGTELELRSRVVEVDPLAQRVGIEMRAFHWSGDELLAEELHRIEMTLYFAHELELMLRAAGFADIEVRGALSDRPPTADDDFVVFIARK